MIRAISIFKMRVLLIFSILLLISIIAIEAGKRRGGHLRRPPATEALRDAFGGASGLATSPRSILSGDGSTAIISILMLYKKRQA